MPSYLLIRGIIPASAGSTLASSIAVKPLRDHPRIRGEHDFRAVRQGCGPGSSPHPRGALQYNYGDATQSRIIPASAGSTGMIRI